MPRNKPRIFRLFGEERRAPAQNVRADQILHRIEQAWGARMFDHWGMTEAGCLAVECVENQGGLHLLETECIAEIIDPKTLESVEAGRVGEKRR